MRRLLPCIIILFFFLPVPGQAAEISECEENTLRCHCPPTVSIGEFSQSQIGDTDPAGDCQAGCRTLFASDTSIDQWALQCSVDGRQSTVAIGAITPQTGPEGAGTTDENREVSPPRLGVDIPGLEFTQAEQGGGSLAINYIGEYVSAVYAWLIGAAALIAVVMFMIGGLEWMMAAGNASQVEKAKKRIQNASVSLVLVLGSYSIAFLIDPNTVRFETLEIQHIERIDFVPNETPFHFTATAGGEGEEVERVGDGNAGYNGFLIFDQTDYGHANYGPSRSRCYEAPTGSSFGSNNIKSSGCGVAAFAGVVSTFGSTTSPEIVAQNFEAEGFRPHCKVGTDALAKANDTNVCGCRGTYASAFFKSSLLARNNLKGEQVVIGDNISNESREKILSALRENTPENRANAVISSYTTDSGGGHYIVLVGIDEENNLLANNPWLASKWKWPMDTYFSRIRSAVIVSKQGS